MTRMPARRVLTTVFLASSVPFLLVVLFPARLHGVMDSGSYLVVHNFGRGVAFRAVLPESEVWADADATGSRRSSGTC